MLNKPQHSHKCRNNMGILENKTNIEEKIDKLILKNEKKKKMKKKKFKI